MENTIYDSNRETFIGFKGDLTSGYKKLIKQELDDGELENARDHIDELIEIVEFKDDGKLLELSGNNGMGFSVRVYKGE